MINFIIYKNKKFNTCYNKLILNIFWYWFIVKFYLKILIINFFFTIYIYLFCLLILILLLSFININLLWYCLIKTNSLFIFKYLENTQLFEFINNYYLYLNDYIIYNNIIKKIFIFYITIYDFFFLIYLKFLTFIQNNKFIFNIYIQFSNWLDTKFLINDILKLKIKYIWNLSYLNFYHNFEYLFGNTNYYTMPYKDYIGDPAYIDTYIEKLATKQEKTAFKFIKTNPDFYIVERYNISFDVIEQDTFNYKHQYIVNEDIYNSYFPKLRYAIPRNNEHYLILSDYKMINLIFILYDHILKLTNILNFNNFIQKTYIGIGSFIIYDNIPFYDNIYCFTNYLLDKNIANYTKNYNTDYLFDYKKILQWGDVTVSNHWEDLSENHRMCLYFYNIYIEDYYNKYFIYNDYPIWIQCLYNYNLIIIVIIFFFFFLFIIFNKYTFIFFKIIYDKFLFKIIFFIYFIIYYYLTKYLIKFKYILNKIFNNYLNVKNYFYNIKYNWLLTWAYNKYFTKYYKN